MKKITIIVPLYNEEKNILPFYTELCSTLKECSQYLFDILFVNDGSMDNSQKIIDELAQQDDRIHYLSFARNFGKEIATTAGIQHSIGDACIMIDVDLQHPPKIIKEFITEWEKDIPVVVGVRTNDAKKGWLLQKLSRLFYKIMNTIGETHLMQSSTDFRLIDRIVMEEFNQMTEHNRITRGLIDWLSFPTSYVHFYAEDRLHGKPKYNKRKLIKLAISSFIQNSLFPLKAAGYFGVIITIFSGLLGVSILIGKYMFQNKYFMSFTGPAQLAILVIFLVGMLLMAMGMMAMYIGNIHHEVRNRPLYIIKNRK